MSEPTTLGSWLRRERERRGVTLAKISEETKVAVPLLEGLEANDLSRWPGGIFRRAFARSYATAIGLDPEMVVRRVEEEHPTDSAEPTTGSAEARNAKTLSPPAAITDAQPISRPTGTGSDVRAVGTSVPGAPVGHGSRFQAAALDLLVAGAIGLGFAAAGSRLLWPVMVIAAYHALGLLLTGGSPMMALLAQVRQTQHPQPQPAVEAQPAVAAAPVPDPAPVRRPENDPRPVRRPRVRRGSRAEPANTRH